MNQAIEYTDKPVRVSPSQIAMWMDCTKSWDFAYVEEIKRKGSKTFFDVGNYAHELLHVYYQMLQSGGRKAGDSFSLSYIQARIKRDLKDVNMNNVETLSKVSKMIEGFISLQSPRIDTGITVLGVELHMEVPVVTPKGRTVILNGILDLAYMDRLKRLRLRDHKTGTDASRYTQKKLELNPQLLTYAVMYELLYGEIITDVEISYINSYDYKKKVPTIDERYALIRQQHTKAAIANFKEHLLQILDLICDQQTYHNYSGDCSRCQYFDICSAELRGTPVDVIKKQFYEKVTRNNGNTELKLSLAEVSQENSTIDPASKKSNSFSINWGGSSFGGGR